MKQTITVASLIDRLPDPTVRKQTRCAVKKLGVDIMSLPAQDLADSLEELLSRYDAPEFAKSASVYRCTIRKLIRWAVDDRLVTIAPPPKEFGYPTFDQFLGSYTKVSTVPRTVWNHFQHFVSSRGIECSKIEARHLNDFREWLSGHVSNDKRLWNLFSNQWNELADAGLVPDKKIENYPTEKPARYAISREDLPETFRQEFKAARDRVLSTGLEERKGKRRKTFSTVDLREAIILRYLGWLRDQRYDLVQHASIADWIQDELIDDYLTATNREGDGLADMGQYQRSILLNMEQHMRHGFMRPDKAFVLKTKRHFYKKNFHVRREESKEIVPLNNVYTVISRLLEQADCPTKPESPLLRALAVRDAVAVLLLAMFAYRREIVTKLRLGTTIRRVIENGSTKYLVLVPKKLTKPRLRDGHYEVPEDFTWLLDFYCYTVRPYLIGKQHDDGYLLPGQAGGALSGASIYRIMTDRSMELLDLHVNPHMLRKSLATEWFEHNPHDLLTLSLIMDCSVQTLERSYARTRTKAALDKFDSNIRQQLAPGKPNAAAAARYQQGDPRPTAPSSTGGL